MGYAYIFTPIYDLGKNRIDRGYKYKLCPYSTQYRELYAQEIGFIYGFDSNNEPLKTTGVVVVGNTTNSDLQGLNYASYPCSNHTTTSGRMETLSNPPSWVCRDPNCYYITLNTGRCYQES